MRKITAPSGMAWSKTKICVLVFDVADASKDSKPCRDSNITIITN
jgi:hypothetical protein